MWNEGRNEVCVHQRFAGTGAAIRRASKRCGSSSTMSSSSMSLLGNVGFVQVAEQCLTKAEYLTQALVATGEWEMPYTGLRFNEHERADLDRLVKALD